METVPKHIQEMIRFINDGVSRVEDFKFNLPTLIGRLNSQNNLNGLKSQNSEIENLTTVSVDWLQGSIPTENLFAIVKFCDLITGELRTYNTGNLFTYDRGVAWTEHGIRVLFDSSEERSARLHRNRCFIQLTGKALSLFDDDNLFSLMTLLLHEFWLVASRIDVCMDDHQRLITPSELSLECEKGNFTGFKKYFINSERRLSKGGTYLSGDTLYFGARGRNGSGKYLRVYDKQLESNGENNAIRWEVEYNRDRAKKIFVMLATCEDTYDLEHFIRLIGQLVTGAIDFVDRSKKDKNIGRLERLPFYQDFIDKLGQKVVRLPKKLISLEQSKDYAKGDFKQRMVAYSEFYGVDQIKAWIDHLAIQGRNSLDPRYIKMLERAEIDDLSEEF